MNDKYEKLSDYFAEGFTPMNPQDQARHNFLDANGIYFDSPNYDLFTEAFDSGYTKGRLDGSVHGADEGYKKGYENGFNAGAHWAKEY